MLLSFLSIFLLESIITSSGMICLAQEENAAGPALGWVGGKYYVSRKVNVPGATVKLEAEGIKKIYFTVTDENGRWDLREIPEGNYSVEIFKEGFVPVRKSDLSVRIPFRSVVELRAEASKSRYGSIANWASAEEGKSGSAGIAAAPARAVRIAGKTVSRDGKALADAEVVLRDMSGGKNPYRALSGSDGTFLLENIPMANYDVSISSVAYLAMRLRLVLAKDLEVHAVMIEQPQNYQYAPSELIPPEEPLLPSI